MQHETPCDRALRALTRVHLLLSEGRWSDPLSLSSTIHDALRGYAAIFPLPTSLTDDVIVCIELFLDLVVALFTDDSLVARRHDVLGLVMRHQFNRVQSHDTDGEARVLLGRHVLDVAWTASVQSHSYLCASALSQISTLFPSQCPGASVWHAIAARASELERKTGDGHEASGWVQGKALALFRFVHHVCTIGCSLRNDRKTGQAADCTRWWSVETVTTEPSLNIDELGECLTRLGVDALRGPIQHKHCVVVLTALFDWSLQTSRGSQLWKLQAPCHRELLLVLAKLFVQIRKGSQPVGNTGVVVTCIIRLMRTTLEGVMATLTSSAHDGVTPSDVETAQCLGKCCDAITDGGGRGWLARNLLEQRRVGRAATVDGHAAADAVVVVASIVHCLAIRSGRGGANGDVGRDRAPAWHQLLNHILSQIRAVAVGSEAEPSRACLDMLLNVLLSSHDQNLVAFLAKVQDTYRHCARVVMSGEVHGLTLSADLSWLSRTFHPHRLFETTLSLLGFDMSVVRFVFAFRASFARVVAAAGCPSTTDHAAPFACRFWTYSYQQRRSGCVTCCTISRRRAWFKNTWTPSRQTPRRPHSRQTIHCACGRCLQHAVVARNQPLALW